VFVPRGVAHGFVNAGEAPARILVWFTPAGMEAFFDRFVSLSAEVGPPEPFRAAGAGAGMEVVGPPLGRA